VKDLSHTNLTSASRSPVVRRFTRTYYAVVKSGDILSQEYFLPKSNDRQYRRNKYSLRRPTPGVKGIFSNLESSFFVKQFPIDEI
jgi:hypothetical protein